MPENSLFSSPGNRVTHVLTFARGLPCNVIFTTKSDRISSPFLGEQLTKEQALDNEGRLKIRMMPTTVNERFNFSPRRAYVTPIARRVQPCVVRVTWLFGHEFPVDDNPVSQMG